MRALLFVLLCSFVTIGCSGQKANERAASKPIEVGDVVANNIIIYSAGRRSSYGDQMLNGDGSFAPAGPTVIYVVRSVSEAEIADLKKEGVNIIAHTAYKVPARTLLSLDVLKAMKPVGHVDAELSDAEVMALFGQG